jgi:predicted NAD/FAD-binding protein
MNSRQRFKVAVIGGGISGMTAAWRLAGTHEVHLYEAAPRLGGHTATIDVRRGDEQLAIDTGFIVFNDRTYPHFCALLAQLGVASRPTPMTFSVSDHATGIEYAGTNLDTLFAQRRNLWSPRFLAMVRDILRFNRSAERHLQTSPELADITLGEYLRRFGYSDAFRDWYLLPMGGAIWSANRAQMDAFPLQFFVRFFRNHGLLDLRNRPQWRTIEGGSRAYIEPLTAPYRDSIHLATPVQQVRRLQGGTRVALTTARGQELFDEVIFACHSDQALAMLADATRAEREVLGAIPYTRNEVVLHTDVAMLPRNPRCWSSWNASLGRSADALPALTYNMNILQGLKSRSTWCVTLNQTALIRPDCIEGIYHYEHPLFTPAGVRAQQRWYEINGVNGAWFCGAWWRNGFHEDGVWSALRVADAIRARHNLQVFLPVLG